MGCTFRARLNNLSSIWYTILVTLLQSYLIYLGFQRYRLYNEIKWPNGGYPHAWLTVYISVYASCIPVTLLFFSFGFFKSGNIAGDNERLADREERVLEVSRNRNGDKSGCVHCLKVFWQHLPPLPQQLHVIMAMSQLIAQQLMFSQLFRNGFVNSGDFLNTEMDFLYQRSRQLATNLPIGETRLQGFRITADELSSLPVSPNLLPILMHLKLFGIPLEFVNLILALIAYSVSYPAVFWRVSKSFSILFSIHLLIYSAQVIWGYLSFQILFRVQETNIHSLRPVGLGQYLGPIQPFGFKLYHPLVILGTFLARLIISTLAPMVVYSYGYNMFHVNILMVQQRNATRNSSANGEYGEYRRKSYNRVDSRALCCGGHIPNGLSIVLLVVYVAAIGPTLYAFLILFQHEQRAIIFTCLLIDMLYMFFWIFMWLGMTCKPEWDFRVTHKVHQLYALQKGMATGAIRGNENPSQLKNSILLVHRDTMFVTDDQNVKQSLLRSIHTGKFEDANQPEDAYWKNQQASPSVRNKMLTEVDGVKNSPEMSRMLRMSDESEQTMSYHSNARGLPPGPMIARGNSSPPIANQFGTIQRNQQQQQYSGMGTLQRAQMGTMQRSVPPENAWNQYASIHKKEQQIVQRRDSGDSHYGNYGSYARIPQSRIQVTPQGGQIRLNGYGVLQQSTLQRREMTPPGQQQQQQINSVRQSPLLSDRSSAVPPPPSVNGREQSPYQRSTVKLSSFAESKGSGIYGTSGIGASNNSVQWGGAQRAPPGQPGQLLWNSASNSAGQNKSSLTSTTNSSQIDEQCFTPTSTLTSHGSNYTPTPGSPQGSNPIYSRVNGASTSSNLYGIATKDYGERTLQKNPIKSTSVTAGNTTIRNLNGVDETVSSFSMKSGGDTGPRPMGNINQNEFATSIV